MSTEQFELIKGGRDDHEKLFQRLLNEPQSFEVNEFANLVDDVFRSRLTFHDIAGLIAKRVQSNVKDPLERNAILAIMNDDSGEASRLQDAIKRRNRLGLRVIIS